MSVSSAYCFSIIIPTFERPKQLASCLESLMTLDYPRINFEVVIVDDGGAHPLNEVLAKFTTELNIVFVHQEKAGPAAARNAGAKCAKGDVLVFIDDDCSPAPDYLRRLAARAAANADCAIGGRTINALTDDMYATTSQLLNDYLYSYYNADPGHARFLASNNMALPADLFRSINGFDATYRLAAAEDRDLCDRLVREGRGLIYAPEAIIYHAHTMTLLKYLRQQFNYGRGAASLRRNLDRRKDGSRRGEPISFYVNLLRFPLSQDLGWPRLLLASLFLVSQMAHSAGFFLSLARVRKR